MLSMRVIPAFASTILDVLAVYSSKDEYVPTFDLPNANHNLMKSEDDC